MFKFDPDFLKNEEKYREMKAEILGDDDEGSDDSDGEEESEEETGGWSHFVAISRVQMLTGNDPQRWRVSKGFKTELKQTSSTFDASFT